MKQGTPEWLAARCGLATASRFSDVLATIKSGEAASRRNYRAQIIAERLTGVPADSYQSVEMKWGTEQEPFSRIAYEARTGNVVIEVAFVQHPTIAAGASPDGFVDDDGQVEIKCPNTATHIDTLLKGMSPDHVPQIQGNLWMSGRKWLDFISYDPRMPERMQLYIQRVPRDDAYIAKLEAEVRKFLLEVDKTIADLEAKLK